MTRTVAVMIVLAAVPAAGQRFEAVESRTRAMGAWVTAVADLDGDGLDDVLLADYWQPSDDGTYTAEDRLVKGRMYEYRSLGDGRFRAAPLIRGTIRVREPVAVVDDFNGDGRDDVAVFDAGVYVTARSSGAGNPPQLFLSQPRGAHRRSNALAAAVRRHHRRHPPVFLSGESDLHIKTATSGDIDNDGDVDLWVESSGGDNVTSHFLINNGDGTFEVDTVRAPYELLHNPEPEFWRHFACHLVDLDNDGDLDLALGQMRDTDSTHVNQSSIVLVNDGTGHFPTRVELPHPRFASGHTKGFGITHYDVNGDGFQDLLQLHQRNDQVDLKNWTDWAGRYIQVLVNRGEGDLSFSDETRTWIGNQGKTRRRFWPGRRTPLENPGVPVMGDINRDGCLDILVVENWAPITPQSPLAYRNNGSGQFRQMAPDLFVEVTAGRGFRAADVNGDGVVDFVNTEFYDPVSIVALVNTTRLRAKRC
ncbi:MAG: VCBS repeat-containing protein [Acidobacteria bacterium]|nr:VCBS repeat-containing protein [Acidobacteriota bacterium]